MQLTRMQKGAPRLGRRPAAAHGGFPLEIRIDPDNNEAYLSLDGQVLDGVAEVAYKAGTVDGVLVQTLQLQIYDRPDSSMLLEALDRLHEIDEAKTPFSLDVDLIPPPDTEEIDEAG